MSFLKKVLSQASDKIKGRDSKSAPDGQSVEQTPLSNGAQEAAPNAVKAPISSNPSHGPVDPSQPFQSAVDRNSTVAPTSTHPHYRFEDFEISRTLGTGSFGRVQLVFHRPTQQYFAMKKLRKSEVVRLKQVEHTNNERALLSRVNHPFIVQMICTFQDDRNLYIVLEYVCGGELFTLLRKVRVSQSLYLVVVDDFNGV